MIRTAGHPTRGGRCRFPPPGRGSGLVCFWTPTLAREIRRGRFGLPPHVLGGPPVQLAAGGKISLVAAVLIDDEKVVNPRRHEAVIVGNVGQHSLQSADRDCWTLGGWKHGRVPRCDVFGTPRPQPKKPATRRSYSDRRAPPLQPLQSGARRSGGPSSHRTLATAPASRARRSGAASGPKGLGAAVVPGLFRPRRRGCCSEAADGGVSFGPAFGPGRPGGATRTDVENTRPPGAS